VKDVTRRSAGYRAFDTHDLCMTLPLLDRAVMDLIEERHVSLSDIMSRPLSRSGDARASGLSFEQREEVRGWLVQLFRALHQLIRAIERRAPVIENES
jgi:hypothetical protein